MTKSAALRHHELDALRGFAMLLGIGVHAATPFVPYWDDSDRSAYLLYVFLDLVHGFRMPLFFILSGYFTTMLWRRHGLGSLLLNRSRRIALPLLIGVVTILPALLAGIAGGHILRGARIRPGDLASIYGRDLDAVDPVTTGSSQSMLNFEGFRFAHLWFLWFLVLFVAGFALVVTTLSVLARWSRRERLVPPRLAGATLWLLPVLAVAPQIAMTDPIFGPDTSEELVPRGIVLAYYACFFTFGALAYDQRRSEASVLTGSIGRHWRWQLAVSVLVLYPIGRWLIDESWLASSSLQVAFAWTTSFGLIGLFRQFMSRENSRVRWLSDASYWMYLAHLPLICIAEGAANRLPLPAAIDFTLMLMIVSILLMASYQYLVRYSWIGTLLNGRRSRSRGQAGQRLLPI